MDHSIPKKTSQEFGNEKFFPSFMAHYPTACHFNTTVDLLDVWSPFDHEVGDLRKGVLGACTF